MWDLSLEGMALTPFPAQVERGRLRVFSRATGQENALYLNDAAAHAEGYPAVLVPPTFLFCLSMDGPNPQEIYELLGVNYAHVLHGEQHFEYFRPAFAGQVLHFAPKIGRLYTKKAGALRFFEWENAVKDSEGWPVANLRSVMVERLPQPRTTHAVC